MDAHRQECLCHVAQPFLPVSVSGVSEHQPQAELDVTSEHQFAAQLDVAGAASAGDVAERRGVDGRGGITEVRAVQQAEGLEAELEPHSLLEGKVLQQGKSYGLVARTAEDVAAGIPLGEVGRRDGV